MAGRLFLLSQSLVSPQVRELPMAFIVSFFSLLSTACDRGPAQTGCSAKWNRRKHMGRTTVSGAWNLTLGGVL